MQNEHQKTQHKSSTPIAVVTGASSGIGYELARVFARNGFDLIIAADSARIFSVAQDFRECGHHDVLEVLQIDLSSRSGVDELCQVIDKYGDRVEAIAVNAGVGVYGRFQETDIEDEMSMMGLNIIGVVQLSKHMVKKFVSRGSGKILFTSSVAAVMPGPFYAVYAASKAFVQSFAEGIREELIGTGVTITALQPGATDTGFFDRAHMQDSKVYDAKKDDPAIVAQQGFEALMAGKDHVVAGSWVNKIQSGMSKFVTEPMKAAMHKQQVGPKH